MQLAFHLNPLLQRNLLGTLQECGNALNRGLRATGEPEETDLLRDREARREQNLAVGLLASIGKSGLAAARLERERPANLVGVDFGLRADETPPGILLLGFANRYDSYT